MLVFLKLMASLLLGVVGGYMLYRGKKIAQPGMILMGGVFLVLSYVLF